MSPRFCNFSTHAVLNKTVLHGLSPPGDPVVKARRDERKDIQSKTYCQFFFLPTKKVSVTPYQQH